MRIVELIPSLKFVGGAERFVIDLSIALKSLGNDVTIIVLYNDASNFFSREVENHGLKVIYLNKKKGVDLSNSRLLRKRILELNPDIVHSHLNTHLSLKLSGLWKKKSTIRFFHTIHTTPDKEVQNLLLFLIMNFVYRKNIVVPIAISDNLSAKTKDYYGLKIKPNSIYNGIFREKFLSSVPLNERKITFISVASFQKVKNQESIVKATSILHKKGYEFNLVFLGEGERLGEIKKLSERLNVDDDEYIKFMGRVSNVDEYLKKSKCLVIPSYYEGNPISVLEAMTAGLIIIATNIGGTKDVIVDGENGYLVDPYNLDDLVNKMETVLLNDDCNDRIYQNNIRKSEKYDMITVARNYLYAFKKGK